MHLYILDSPKNTSWMRVGAFLGGEEGLRELTVGGMQLIVQGGGGACDKNPQILDF